MAARSLELDSSFAPALEHGTSLALALGDTAGARKALALIMRVDAGPKLFGYPAIAIVLFLMAAAAGAGLVVSIAISDLPQHRRRRR